MYTFTLLNGDKLESDRPRRFIRRRVRKGIEWLEKF